MSHLKRVCRLINSNFNENYPTEAFSCVYSLDYNLLAWSNSNRTVNLINFNQLCLNDKIEKHQQAQLQSGESQEFIISIDEIKQTINCGEAIWSLAFGSSKSQVKNKRSHHKHSRRVNTRFKLDDLLILAVGLESGSIRIYDASICSLLFILRDHKDIVRDLKFTINGSFQLASVSRDETIKLWDMFDDGNMYKTLDTHIGCVNSCAWSPTSSLLCTVGMNRQAYLWDTDTFKVKFILKGHMNEVVQCEFSSDGALLATASFDTKVFIWNPYTGALMKQFYHLLPPPRPIFASGANGANVRKIKFNPSGTNLLSLCEDKIIRIWSTTTRTQTIIDESSQSDGVSCAYSSNGEFIFIGTRNGQIDVYKSPQIVERLVDICRRMVNQLIERENISKLNLPNDLENFLCYDDQKIILNSNSKITQKPLSNSNLPKCLILLGVYNKISKSIRICNTENSSNQKFAKYNVCEVGFNSTLKYNS